MPIHIIAVGNMKEKGYRLAAEEYLKRLTRYDKVWVTEVADMPEPQNAGENDIRRVMEAEGEKILPHIRPEDMVWALCIGGSLMNSEEFAMQMRTLKDRSQRCVFVIGGSNGLGDHVLARAQRRLSFSPMTFPHQLARVMLLEQVYRACKINANERYHK